MVQDRLSVNFIQGPDYAAKTKKYSEDAKGYAEEAAQSEYNANAYSIAASRKATESANSAAESAEYASNSEASAANAYASEQAAATSEANAKESELASAQSETNAHASEVAARNSADSSANSANASANSANEAQGSAGEAQISANSASASASNATYNAEIASTAANIATQKATEADNSAKQAQLIATQVDVAVGQAHTAAQLAVNASETAQEAADTAITKATEAATSATEAAQSASEAEEANIQAKEMAKLAMDKIAESAIGYPHQQGTLTYNEQVQSPTWDIFYEPQKMTVTGQTSATNAGTYTITMTPKATYYWWDTGSTAPRTQTWEIQREIIPQEPSLAAPLIYDGTVKTPTWLNYDSTKLTIGGDMSGTERGSYTTTFTPKANYKWFDNTTTTKSVVWKIYPQQVEIPTVTDTVMTYNGEEQSPTISAYDSDIISVTGNTAINVGTYVLTFHLKDNSIQWTDGTTADKKISWEIVPATVAVPTLSDTAKTYNGEVQSPTISEYNTEYIEATGDLSATNAGNYTITFHLLDPNVQWVDTTTTNKTATWNIAKANGYLSISPSIMTLTYSAPSATAQVTRAGNGTISVISGDESIATASISNNVITINGVSDGTTNIVVNVAEDDNYFAPAAKDIYVSVNLFRHMTVNIDLSDRNPETCCTYADDAVGMTPGSDAWDEFFGHYPVMFKDGVEGKKLQRNDFTKYEDGTNADITTGAEGDVMIAFPRRGLNISKNGNIITISMTGSPNDVRYEYMAHKRGNTLKEKFYLGAYKGSEVSSKLRSLSGKTCANNKSISEFRPLAQANGAPDGNGGSGYDQSGWYQLVYRQCMYVLKYKTLNSQSAVGRGFVDDNSEQKPTGGTETKGMDWGESTGKDHMKLFGLEDFWGNIYEWIDGCCSDTNRNILTATEGFNDTGANYTSRGIAASANVPWNYMSSCVGNTHSGFITTARNGSETTYFCDYATLYSSANHNVIPEYGGYWKEGSHAGAFILIIASSVTDDAAAFVGARLMYV